MATRHSCLLANFDQEAQLCNRPRTIRHIHGRTVGLDPSHIWIFSSPISPSKSHRDARHVDLESRSSTPVTLYFSNALFRDSRKSEIFTLAWCLQLRRRTNKTRSVSVIRPTRNQDTVDARQSILGNERFRLFQNFCEIAPKDLLLLLLLLADSLSNRH